jgi:NADH-quinone oxidoreductase subunit A
MNHSYFPILIFFAVALAVPLGALALARVWMTFFTPLKPGKDKQALYECGVNPLSDRQTRFHSQYYMFGLLFLLFDVETIFLLPFAVAFLGLDYPSFIAAMIFLLLLAEGLVWAWSKGLLDWRAKPIVQAVRSR